MSGKRDEKAGELARALLTERARFRDEVVEALLAEVHLLRKRAERAVAGHPGALAADRDVYPWVANSLERLAERLTRPDTSKQESQENPFTRAAEFVQRYGVDPERILAEAERTRQERILEAPVQAGAAWDATLPKVAPGPGLQADPSDYRLKFTANTARGFGLPKVAPEPDDVAIKECTTGQERLPAGPSWDAPLPGEVAHEAPPEAEPCTWEEHEKAKAAVSPEPDSISAGQGAVQSEPVSQPAHVCGMTGVTTQENCPACRAADPYRVLISRADLRELLSEAELERGPYHDRPLYKRVLALLSGPAHHCPPSAPQGGSGALGAAQGQQGQQGQREDVTRPPLDALARYNRALQDTVARLGREKEDLKEALRQRTVQRDLAEQDARELHARLSAKLERSWRRAQRERDEYRRLLGLSDDKLPEDTPPDEG